MKIAALYPILTLLAVGLAAPLTTQADPPAPPPGQPFQNDGDRGNGNTSEGKDALFSLTTGANNTGLGFQALYSNTSGNRNTATGANALLNNTTGTRNTATGNGALFSNN